MADVIEKKLPYRSLVGGKFSSTPSDISIKRSIRTNNPGALNISAWQKEMPGYVGWTFPDNSPNGNKTTIYASPEEGAAAWVKLMDIYIRGGYDEVGKIIDHYGGGQDYSGYLAFVLQHEPTFTEETKVNLNDEATLVKLLKVMSHHEMGPDVPYPWSNTQLTYGVQLGRSILGLRTAPRAPATQPQVPVATKTVTETGPSVWNVIAQFILSMMGASKVVAAQRELKRGDTSPKGGDVWKLQERLREIGFVDLVVDGDFGPTTDKAVRTFQDRENLDPDGEVGELTLRALNRPGAHNQMPPLMPPPAMQGGVAQVKPPWYGEAEKDIGWKEIGNNANIEYFLKDGKPRVGQKGEPYCAHAVNAWLGRAGLMGSGSGMARSYENSSRFVRLKEPALGCICTMWRTSKASGQGHVYLYDGESPKGIRGIGANEDDTVKRSFHDRTRWTGYWWPKEYPLPTSGKILVSDGGSVVARSET